MPKYNGTAFLCLWDGSVRLRQKLPQHPLPVAQEQLGDLVAAGLLVGAGVDGPVVKGEEDRPWDGQENGGVGGLESLGPGLG